MSESDCLERDWDPNNLESVPVFKKQHASERWSWVKDYVTRGGLQAASVDSAGEVRHVYLDHLAFWHKPVVFRGESQMCDHASSPRSMTRFSLTRQFGSLALVLAGLFGTTWSAGLACSQGNPALRENRMSFVITTGFAFSPLEGAEVLTVDESGGLHMVARTDSFGIVTIPQDIIEAAHGGVLLFCAEGYLCASWLSGTLLPDVSGGKHVQLAPWVNIHLESSPSVRARLENRERFIIAASYMFFPVEEARVLAMDADGQLQLVGQADTLGAVEVPRDSIEDAHGGVLLFCAEGYFCGAWRVGTRLPGVEGKLVILQPWIGPEVEK